MKYGIFTKGHKVPTHIRNKIAKTLSKKIPSYDNIHYWLVRHYGKPQHCDNPKCPHTSNNYEWALKKGKTHEKKRSSYKRLCKACHFRYDSKGKKWGYHKVKK